MEVRGRACTKARVSGATCGSLARAGESEGTCCKDAPIAPGLEEKLGKLALAHAVAGSIASYFAGSINVFSSISSIRITWWFSGLETILTV
ncbi:hypothetical protein Goshw_015554 [Gossypium schwendimanii]|uniref:Uncharacterized protein n=1 Tax=Gossypium schwendimanii TaxID=34291 RepID=A0A7J9MHV7_GOSSC|nr:hypothetical protein [Gossypium schwendimanii]